jgi:hypothetical protein
MGPAGRIPIPDIVEALVRARAEQANGGTYLRISVVRALSHTRPPDTDPERRARYTGGFSCVKCNHFNLLRLQNGAPASERWYCVVSGLEVGVFQGR